MNVPLISGGRKFLRGGERRAGRLLFPSAHQKRKEEKHKKYKRKKGKRKEKIHEEGRKKRRATTRPSLLSSFPWWERRGKIVPFRKGLSKEREGRA